MTQSNYKLETLSSANFGMVMATGIISTAAALQGMPLVASSLFYINIALYTILWSLYLTRLALHRRAFVNDLCDHLKGPPFFTIIAATNVLGTQFINIAQAPRTATALCILGGALWLFLLYTVFTALTIKVDKPSLDKGISGAWLLAVVGTQSIAVLGGMLNAPGGHWELELNYLTLSMWLLGGMLYLWLISLIFYRYLFFPFQPSDLAPPYWINMGAMAISTLAGATLITNAQNAPFLTSMLPFIKGFTVFYWATGTWWIPMLIVLAIWRHAYKRFPLRYDPLYWGAIFPLGMYSVATLRLARALNLQFLLPLARVFAWVALLAWTLAFIGLLRRTTQAIAQQPRNRTPVPAG